MGVNGLNTDNGFIVFIYVITFSDIISYINIIRY
jgi:hypothetical protein